MTTWPRLTGALHNISVLFILIVHALFFQDESAAGAKNDEYFVCVVQAAAAWVAAIVAVRPVCESSLLVFSFAGVGSWISLRVCSSFPGLWKEQRNISLQSEDEESSDLQALIQEASVLRNVSSTLSRVRTGMTLTVACLWDWERLPDGWTSPSVSQS